MIQETQFQRILKQNKSDNENITKIKDNKRIKINQIDGQILPEHPPIAKKSNTFLT